MAFPTRSRGLRRIIVNDTVFRWRLSTKESDSVLMVYVSSAGMPLRVTLLGWKDFWTVFPFYTPNTPEIVSSDFVRQAIEFGLKSGWTPDARGAAFEIEWRDEEFRLGNQSEDSRSTNSA